MLQTAIYIIKQILIYSVLLFFINGCYGGKTMDEKSKRPSLSEIPKSSWQKLSKKRIYFGHQSVGDNILYGIEKILKANNDINLNIMKTTDPEKFDKPVFAHSSIGKNDYPESKIEAFNEYIQKGIGNKTDIAFFKFCFWDIKRQTDIKKVFNDYKETISALKLQYPKTKFIHFTVPLMFYPTGIKTKIKRALNMTVEDDIDNIRRNELNELILKEYNGKEPVFDIAMVESTLPDGSRAVFLNNGGNYYYLAAEYTNDGGHLNEEAKKIVAEQLLIFLAKLSEKE